MATKVAAETRVEEAHKALQKASLLGFYFRHVLETKPEALEAAEKLVEFLRAGGVLEDA